MLHAKLGRNDPCPCGSGNKFKKCCAREQAQTLASGSAKLVAAPDLAPLLPLAAAGRYVELEGRATGMLELYPDSGHLWKILGAALWNQGKNALEALETAALLLPADAEAQCNVGNVLRASGRLEDAVARHQQAIAIDARYAEAHNNLGSALRDLGRHEEAVASYRRALALKPDFAMAHHNIGIALLDLGNVSGALTSFRRALVMKPDYWDALAGTGRALEQLGRLEEALASYRHALQIRPADAGMHQSAGTLLLRLRRFMEAAQSFGTALELNPRLTEAHNNLGNSLRELGQIDAAAESYRRVLALDPDSAEAHNNLGSVLIDLGRWEQAEESYRRVLEIKPDQAKAYNSLGNVLRLLNRAQESEAAYRQGLEIDPDSSETLSSLADLHADRGLFDQAETLYRRVLDVNPDFPRAWASIAGLRKMTAADGEWIAQAQKIAEQDLPARKEVLLRYAMGKYCDDVKEYDRAFDNYRRANELTKTYRPAHDRQQLSHKFDLTKQFYDRDWLNEAKMADANGSNRPVLIVGMPRSGTSLAEQILASHPAVFGAGELPFWNQASAKVAAAAVRGEPAHAAVAIAADEYLQILRQRSTDSPRVVDKMPGNFAYVGLISSALPNARFIHMRRHPLDTCLSVYFQNFHLVHSYTNDLGDLAHYYREYLSVMDHWRSMMPPDTILEVPYEALIEDPESWARKMVEFIGLPWNPACLDYQRTARDVNTFSRWQVRQKISKSSVERWRNYAPHIELLMPLAEVAAGDLSRAELVS